MFDHLRHYARHATVRLMRERLRQFAELFDLRTTVSLSGLGMVGYGLSLIYPPAAYIVCGAVLFWLGAR